MKALSWIIVLLSTSVTRAHYTFPKLIGSSDWQYVRKTTNYNSNGPIQNVPSEQIRCQQLAPGSEGAKTMTIQAGSTLSWGASPNIFHPGPLSGWMAKVPEGETGDTFDGSGNVWFKVYQEMPTIGGGRMTWASQGKTSVNFPIPRCLTNGDYLFRIEHNALHGASASGGAQFYISCAQVRVAGGSGAKAPTGLVAFPGAYKATDPGIMVNIYSAKTYTPAGPAVFTC